MGSAIGNPLYNNTKKENHPVNSSTVAEESSFSNVNSQTICEVIFIDYNIRDSQVFFFNIAEI